MSVKTRTLTSREALYSELDRLMVEDTYNFGDWLRCLYIQKYRDDPEFSEILKDASIP